MKPLALTMIAFGPYKEVEKIDLNKLNEQNLYVISGVTGAGKTTIFDAICFALYGLASGSDRDNVRMLRSQFAEDDVHTSVELRFSLSGRQYRIFRQMPHVKEGNVSSTGDKHEFYQIIDGEEIPCVDRQMVTDINEKVEELIGLNHNQFRQIVMLPQGEFRKLLTSSTENKEVILRKLFKTDRFQHMNALLKEKRNKLENDLDHEKRAMEIYIGNIPNKIEKRDESPLFQLLEQEYYHMSQMIPALEEEKRYFDVKKQIDEQTYLGQAKKYEKMQKEVYDATELNKQFDSLAEKKKSLDELLEKRQLMSEKEEKLEAAKKAQLIEPYELHFLQRQEEQQKQVQAVKDTKELLEQAASVLEKAKGKYSIENDRTKEREDLYQEIYQYKEFEKVVIASESTRKELVRDKNELEQLDKKVKDLKKYVDENSDNIENRRTEIEKLTENINENREKKYKINELRSKYNLLNSYIIQTKEINKLKEKVLEKQKVLKEIEAEYNEAEKSWQHNQAYLLASQLLEGDECPVCGSAHHPHKATVTEGTVEKETLDRLKRDFEVARNDVSKVKGQYDANVAQLEKIARDIKANHEIAESEIATKVVEVVEQGKKMNGEVSELEKNEQKLTDLKKVQKEAEELVKSKTKERETINELWQKKQNDFTTKLATFNTQMEKIPEELQRVDILQAKLKAKELTYHKMLALWESVQEELKKAEKVSTEMSTSLKSAEEQMVSVEGKLSLAKKEFLAQLTSSEFSTEKAYKVARLNAETRDKLEREISHYKQTVHTLTKQVDELTGLLKGRERLDLHELEEKLRQLKETQDVAYEHYNRSKENFKEIASTIGKLQDIWKRSEKLEKKLSMVVELHDTVRGQNEQKISLERFLQIDFLEQIMQAANVRFYDLSNGQYRLLRSDRQESRGRQSGLSIDVYDTYTSQTRDVKTLSGGEKFIASLCLALGMSDVIQSFQGSVSIETMFIDEGFGSLDAESLQKAIDALVHLQQDGRIIGVISHVDELKMNFPAMLEVTKTKDGFSKTEIIVK